MKRNQEAGFSLIETLVAITILAAIVVPVCSGLLLSIRLNAKTEQMMQAEHAVSSAVETLMAEGITGVTAEGKFYDEFLDADGQPQDRFPDVKVVTSQDADKPYYNVEVTDNNKLVSVKVAIRAKEGG